MKNRPFTLLLTCFWLTMMAGCTKESITPDDTWVAPKTTHNAREIQNDEDEFVPPPANTITFVVASRDKSRGRKQLYILADTAKNSISIESHYRSCMDTYKRVEIYALLTGRMPPPPPQCDMGPTMPCPDGKYITVEWIAEDKYQLYYHQGYGQETVWATFSSPAFQTMIKNLPNQRLVGERIQ